MDFQASLAGGLWYYVDVLTVVVSVVAVIYWILLFRRMSITEGYEEGWLWIFGSVLLVLLLNLSTILMDYMSGVIELWGGWVFVFTDDARDFVLIFSRLMMAVSISIGTYRLHRYMKSSGIAKFALKPIEPISERESPGKSKYLIEAGESYLIVEDGTNTPSLDIFVDLVTHGIMGLCITRRFPNKLREERDLHKTPIVWLTKEKTSGDSLHPADLTELSHMIKGYITKGGDTAVLLDGVEYLVLHNTFDEILKLLEGLADVAAQKKCRLIVGVDPKAITEQQFHLLKRNLKEFMP